MSFKLHLIKLIIFALILSAVNGILVSFTQLGKVSLPSWLSILLFFALTSISLHYILNTFKKKNAMDKNMSMYLNTILKLVVSLLAFIVLIKCFPDDKQLVAIPFMLYYFLFTAFEMYLIKSLKRPIAK